MASAAAHDENVLTMKDAFKYTNLIRADLRQKLKRSETNQNKVKSETQADGFVIGSSLGWLLSDKAWDEGP